MRSRCHSWTQADGPACDTSYQAADHAPAPDPACASEGQSVCLPDHRSSPSPASRPRDRRSFSQNSVEQIPQPQFLKQLAHHQQRTPPEGLEDVDVAILLALQLGSAFQDATEVGKHGAEQIAATEVGYDALFDLAVLAVGFDDAQVFIEGTVGRGDSDSPYVHDKW